MILTLVFEKNAHFFAENWRKSQKIVIITSPNLVTLTTATAQYLTGGFSFPCSLSCAKREPENIEKIKNKNIENKQNKNIEKNKKK
jgi:hypothetical protein